MILQICILCISLIILLLLISKSLRYYVLNKFNNNVDMYLKTITTPLPDIIKCNNTNNEKNVLNQNDNLTFDILYNLNIKLNNNDLIKFNNIKKIKKSYYITNKYGKNIHNFVIDTIVTTLNKRERCELQLDLFMLNNNLNTSENLLITKIRTIKKQSDDLIDYIVLSDCTNCTNENESEIVNTLDIIPSEIDI